MRDNTTAHSAAEYDKNIRKSIPFYDQFHEATINIVSSYLDAPTTWIDVGCGTGTFVERAYEVFRTTKFVLVDPSAAMLDLAKDKLSGKDRAAILGPTTAEHIDLDEQADVISATQSLHYLDANGRRRAVRNCHHLLRPGGMFITFENIRPLTQKGTDIGKRSWQDYEVRAGKSKEEARKHVDRLGVEFFPITIEEHLRLLRETEFKVVELLWYHTYRLDSIASSESRVNITNRWSSRLGGSLEPRVPSRTEPRSLGVLGGAAQLYVMLALMIVHIMR